MAKDRNGSAEGKNGVSQSNKRDRLNYDSEPDPDSDSESDVESRKSEGSRKRTKKKNKTRTSSSKRKRSRDSDSYSSSSDYDDSSDSEAESGSSYYSDSEEERRRRRKERKRSEEKKERRRREKEKDKKRKRKEEEKKKLKKKKDKKKEKGKKGAVTNSWGKYGIIRETDMWNKRPEFTAWLAEVKQVNLESLPNWEEKQMFKQFMEDHNTATFPSKKYYDLDAYYRHKIEKEIKRGIKKLPNKERTVFDDEEQRRLELMRERERQKEEQVEALKWEMQSGMAQAMKEQARLKEEMAYQYKLGNFEAAAAIQRRLDPDVAM